MARNAKAVKFKGNSDMVAPDLEPGGYPARLVGVVFVGVQKQRPWQGTVKDPIDEVRLTYELSGEFMHDQEGNPIEDKPRWFSEQIPFHSLNNDKAKSSKRYKALDPKDEADGDFRALLGKPCTLVLIQNPGKGQHAGKVFTNIGDVTAPPRMAGYKQPKLINEPFYFDLNDEECTIEQFRALPEFVQDTIKKADDFPTSVLARLLNGNPARGNAAVAPEPEAGSGEDQDDDDSPY